MKTLMACSVACAILAIGAIDVLKYKKTTVILDEIISFVRFTQNELRFRSSDYYSLLESAKNQNYKYFDINDNKITVDGTCNEKVKQDFYCFIQRIGTTDTQGQLLLCEEYLQKFGTVFDEHMEKENSRLQVDVAISILSAVCVLVLFV